MYDIIKHYKVLVLGLAFILWATLLVSTESKTEKLNVTYIQIQVMLKLNLLI
jgi:hypothetical protein